MSNKSKKELLTLTFLLLAGIISLAYVHAYSMVVVYVAVIALVAYVVNKKYSVYLYVFFLPFGSIVGTEYNLFSIIGIDEVVAVMVIYYFWELKPISYRNIGKYQKIAIKLILLIAAVLKLRLSTRGSVVIIMAK